MTAAGFQLGSIRRGRARRARGGGSRHKLATRFCKRRCPWEIDTEHPGRPAVGVPVSARATRRWRATLGPASAMSPAPAPAPAPALLLHLRGLERRWSTTTTRRSARSPS